MEVTRVVTLELTTIHKDGQYEAATEEDRREFAESIREFFDVDNVVVTNVQDFIQEDNNNGDK